MRAADTILILSDVPAAHADVDTYFTKNGHTVDHLGFSTLTNKRMPKDIPSCVVLILKQFHVDFRGVLKRIESKYGSEDIPVLALVDSVPPFEIDCFDSVLLQPCHPQQVLMRVTALTRLSTMQREIGLRLQTLQEDFNLSPQVENPVDTEKLSILFIGKASPEFMVIINALQRQNVQIIAAFTSFTAFDYLYEKSFDAVVMNGLESTEPAFTVADTMRKNAKLYHVPALLLVNGGIFGEQDKAYENGVSDIINAGAPIEEIRTRVLEQANFRRTHNNLKRNFSNLGGATCLDATTGLYNAHFFNAHLRRLSEFYDLRAQPNAICLIRVNYHNADMDQVSLASAYKQVGSMIKNLVRMQDMTARLDTNLFAIAFPGQSANQLNSVAKRISSILECATLTDPISGEALNIQLEVTMNTLNDQAQKHSAA